MKQLLVILPFFVVFHLTAQETSSKWDFRLGFGSSAFQGENPGTLLIENELNYHFNSYLGASFSLAYGKGKSERSFSFQEIKSYSGQFRSLWQSNLMFYLSPFQNTAKMNFRIGAGLSRQSLVNSAISEQSDPQNGERKSYRAGQRNVLGGNFSLEYTFTTKKQWLIGAKYAVQPYGRGVIHEALLLKIGRKLYINS